MFKSLLKYGFAVFLALACATLIVQMKYNLSLPEYLAYSMPLTQEEKEYIKEHPKLVCSIDPDVLPYSFINLETAKPEGMAPDYMTALAIEIGAQADFEYNEGEKSVQALKDEKVDIISAFYSKKGSPDYLPAQKLYRIRGVIVSKADAGYAKTAKDLEGKKVAVVREASMEEKFLEDIKYTDKTKFISVCKTKDALRMLLEGKFDVVVGVESLIRHNAEELKLDKKIFISTDPVFDGYMTIGVNSYETTLLNIVNKGLLKIKKNGIMMQTERKWLGDTSPAVEDNASVEMAQYIMLFCVMTVIILMFWEGVLNRRIDAKTKEINYQKNNMQQVIDSIGSMLVLINKNGRIEYCNKCGCDLIGMSQDEIRRKELSEIDIIENFTRMLGENFGPKVIFYKGRYYNVRFEDIKAKKGSRLLIGEDCTEKRFTEQKLRQESKMIAVGQLSAGLAHEIRNPLGLIKNYSYILKGYANDDMSKHSLDVIGDSVERINTLIENLLKFSRLSGDAPTRFDIGKSLENIFALEKKKFEKAGIEFRLIYPKSQVVFTREETIKIVSYNLMNNAIEAIEGSGMKDGKLRVKATIDNDILYMEFKNNGPKISEDQIENIFNPFFTTKETGTGLGLYIVSAEIDKIGGSIAVSSNEKETSFCISIPMEVKKDDREEEL